MKQRITLNEEEIREALESYVIDNNWVQLVPIHLKSMRIYECDDGSYGGRQSATRIWFQVDLDFTDEDKTEED